ncbi:MAG: MMPL family transporter, partial [Actinomycetota bacterium]|nr:MMPL family transporter [Actinomycetota bacterium]
MSHTLYRMGCYAARRPWTVIGAWFAVAIIVVPASASLGRKLENSFEVPGLDSQNAVDLLREVDSDRAGLTTQLVISPLSPEATFFDSSDELERVPDAAARSGAVSPDGRVAVIRLQYEGIDELSTGDLEVLKDFLAERRADSPLQIEASGDLFFSFEQPETGIGEMMGLVVAIVILLLAFGSLIAMGLPIGMALFGLALGVSSMGLVTYLIEIPSWAPQMGSMVGLGVGIDYALFLVTRQREFLARGMTIEESVGRAVATAGQAVIFAGGTVVIAILGLAVAGIGFMTAAGVAISVIVLIMVAASVTLLPAFLGLAGHWINRLGIHRSQRSSGRHGPSGSTGAGWERWGRHVSAHAWPYAIGVTVALLALTAPVLSLRLGFPDDGSLPDSRSERRAYDLVAEGFGPGVNGPLIIAID